MVIVTLLDPQTSVALQQWQFSQEAIIRIGRALNNHVVLTDPLVSRHHLEVRQISQPNPVNPPTPNPPTSQHSAASANAASANSSAQWQLVNHSRNGTFLNGAIVTVEPLPAEAVVQLAQGGPRLRFQIVAGLPVVSPALQLPPLPKSVPPVLAMGGPMGRPSGGQSSDRPFARSSVLSACAHPGHNPANLFCIHCGQPVAIVKTVRHYHFLQTLGRGGMGTTYLVWTPQGVKNSIPASDRGKLLVLKEMNADVARIPKAQELFEREASTLQALHHPGIPRFYDFFIENGKKYLVMELIHGQDLEKRVRSHGPVSPTEAIAWMIQVCNVLTYLHSRPVPIIHRDIKPGNLLVQAVTNRVVVLDFGAVKAAGMPSGTRIGAEGYSAPEQTQGRPVPQSDLYAIGPSLVFLLTGEHPQRFYKKLGQSYRLVPEGIPAIDASLQAVIQRVTEPRVSDRYATAKDLAHALAFCSP